MYGSKTCFKCQAVKPLGEFYKHKMMADGHLNKCKECTKSDVQKNRADNIDYYLEYDRARGYLTKRVKARADYSKTPEGRAAFTRSAKVWRELNTVKRAAHIITRNALRSGALIRAAECSTCGVIPYKTHGHHDDYAQPLVVRWLCPKCHSAWHKQNGPGANG